MYNMCITPWRNIGILQGEMVSVAFTVTRELMWRMDLRHAFMAVSWACPGRARGQSMGRVHRELWWGRGRGVNMSCTGSKERWMWCEWSEAVRLLLHAPLSPLLCLPPCPSFLLPLLSWFPPLPASTAKARFSSHPYVPSLIHSPLSGLSCRALMLLLLGFPFLLFCFQGYTSRSGPVFQKSLHSTCKLKNIINYIV